MATVKVKVTLCLDVELRESEVPHVGHREAVYDVLNGATCWAAVNYAYPSSGGGVECMHFRLEGLGLPSLFDYSFDRKPPPGVTFVPNGRGALVPVIANPAGLSPALPSSGKGDEGSNP